MEALEAMEPDLRKELEEAFRFFDREGDGQIEKKVGWRQGRK